jgi:hypothetical protein
MPTGVPARASETSVGRPARACRASSVTTPTACASRAAVDRSASSNSAWYCAVGWYSIGRDSA